MKVIYSKKFETWFLIVPNMYQKNIWDIIGYGNCKDSAYIDCIRRAFKALKKSKNIIQDIGEMISFNEGSFDISDDFEIGYVPYFFDKEEWEEEYEDSTSFCHFIEHREEEFSPCFC